MRLRPFLQAIRAPCPFIGVWNISSENSIVVASLGTPRIGRRRELKAALEAYWSGALSAEQLLASGRALRRANWLEQRERGVTRIPSNDFSLYDHILDTAVMVGAVPARFGWQGGEVPIDTYFAMARGSNDIAGCGHAGHGHGTTALEMTKWFDTN